MQVHRRSVERVVDCHERLDRTRADHRHRAPGERLALGRVEVAHPGEHNAGRIHPARAETRVPEPGRTRERHPTEVAAGRGVRGVEVAVGVEPEHPRVRAVREGGRHGGESDRALRGEQHGVPSPGEGVVHLATRLEQASARVAQVRLVALLAGLVERPDQPRLGAEPLPHQQRQLLRAEGGGGRAVRGAAAQDYQ
jgi:hypothetical protein